MNDSDRLLAAGIPLVLKDGREVRLRYGMRGLKQIEDEFGSVAVIQKRLAVDEGIASGKAIGTVYILLSIGLMREGLSEDKLDELLDPAELTRYVEAIGLAFPAGGKGLGEGGKGLGEPKKTPRRAGRPLGRLRYWLAIVAFGRASFRRPPVIASLEAGKRSRAARRAIPCIVRRCRSHATHRFLGRSGELYFCRFHAGRIHVDLEELIPERIYAKRYRGIRWE